MEERQRMENTGLEAFRARMSGRQGKKNWGMPNISIHHTTWGFKVLTGWGVV